MMILEAASGCNLRCKYLENKNLLVIVLALAGLLSLVVVDKYSSPEAFLCNIKKLGQVYENKQTTDE
jgi:hypothetical protein